MALAYAALNSLKLTINGLRRSTRIPYIQDSGIFTTMQLEIYSLKKLLGIFPPDEEDEYEEEECKSLKDVTREIIERTCRLEDLLEESKYHIGRDKFHARVIDSATEMVKKMKEQLSNEALWPEQLLKTLPNSGDTSQLQLASIVWMLGFEIIEHAYQTVVELAGWVGVADTYKKQWGEVVERETRLLALRLDDVLGSYVSNHFLSESQILDVDLAMTVRQEIIFFIETSYMMVEHFRSLRQQPEEDDEEDYPALVFSRTDYFEGKKSKMFGLDDELIQLKDWLLKDTPELLVVPIVGMAGIGKTTLAKEIYEHPDIVSRFECRVFVSVGPNYFKDQKTLQDIQAQMDHEIDGRRCLIVLDDVWSDDIWFDLTSFSGNELHNGSRIIMTTRLEEVAESDKRKRMRLGRFVLKKRFLNQQESWLLFCDKMFGGDHSSCPPELQESAREIVNKCEGLPLTIIAVANHLCQAERMPEYWEQVAKKVHTDIISADKATSQVLYRSYKHLQIYLKPCFLYMGVFPHDSDITASKLIKLWCAEGLLEPGVGKSSLEEYKAMEYLQELVSANVVKVRQRSSSGGIKTCNIYPVFWHICMREAAEHKFFHVIDSNGNHGIESQHRHCIHNNGLFGIKDVRKSMTSIPNTRSILCTGPHHQYPVPICLDFSLLRVLDALTIRFYCFPSEVVKLVQLRYLAFTYNGKLPASISKLWNLEYLIVRQYLNILSSGAHRPYLPKEIWDMRGLRHLQVMGSDLPDPSYDGALLPNLSTLLGVSARSCTKEILGRIPRLKKLGIQIELALNVDKPLCCFDHLVSLHRLESLKCVIVNPNSKLQVVIPAPPASIFPLSLRKLTLSGLGFPWEYMSTIVELSYLEVLKLQCYAFRGAVWKAEDEHCFRKLKFLLIEDTDMEVWDASDVDFPSLEHLIIRHCYKLKEIPEKFGDIGPLQTIELVDCSPSLMASANIIQDRLMYLKKGFQVCIESSVDDRKLKPRETPWLQISMQMRGITGNGCE